MTASTSHLQAIPGKDIVIIGDGPAALMIAIKLKQKGVQNVTVVGPRLGDYTRSGDYQLFVFDKVEEAIAPLKITPSEGCHIKDIERQLYSYATSMDIKLIKGKFDGFANQKQLVLKDSSNKNISMHADMVFDCTGTRREVINQFNQRSEPGPRFTIKQVGDFSNKSHALVRASLPDDDLQSIANLFLRMTNPNPISYTLAMEEMHRLGWPDYTLPMCYTHHFPNKSGNLRKANIYLQIPAGLSNEDIVKFVQIILKLSKNDPSLKAVKDLELHHPSTKHGSKPIISSFEIDPHQTTPAYYLGDADYPIIFHAGDATADLHFRLGTGLMLGIDRLNDIIDAFDIHHDEIRGIDLQRFDEKFKLELQRHTDAIQGLEKTIRNEHAQLLELDQVHQMYTDAHSQCSDVQDKATIKNGLDAVSRQYVLMLHKKGKSHLESIANDLTGFDTANINFEITFHQILAYFVKANHLMDSFSSEEKIPLKEAFLNMAARCKELATYYSLSTPPKYNLAERWYNQSLQIHTDLLAGEYLDMQLDLYAHLIITAYRTNDLINIIPLYEKIEREIIPSINNSDKSKKTLDKIYYHTGLAMLNEAKKLMDISGEEPDKIKDFIMKTEQLISKISPDSIEYSRLLTRNLSDLTDQAPQYRP